MSEQVRAGARSPEELRPLKITPDFVSTADGSVFVELGGTRVLVRRQGGQRRARLATRQRGGLADGGVLAAAEFDPRPHAARGGARQAGRQDGRDPALHRALSAHGHRHDHAR